MGKMVRTAYVCKKCSAQYAVKYHAVDHEINCPCNTPLISHQCETCSQVFLSKDEIDAHECPATLQLDTCGLYSQTAVPECKFIDVDEADRISACAVADAQRQSVAKAPRCRCFLITILTIALVGLCAVAAGFIYKYKYNSMPTSLKSRAMAELESLDAVRPSVTNARAKALRRQLYEGKRIKAEDVLSWYGQ